MTLAMLDADVNVINGFHPKICQVNSSTAEVNSSTAEDTQSGHQNSPSATFNFKDNSTNDHLAASNHDTFHKECHKSSASATNGLEEPAQKFYQADYNTLNGDHPPAYQSCPSTNLQDDLLQMDVHIANGTGPDKMQNSTLDLGPHSSITVREWELLRNTVNLVTPLHVDDDYLGLANITAVSRWVNSFTVGLDYNQSCCIKVSLPRSAFDGSVTSDG